MSFRSGLNEWLSIFLKIAGIFLAIFGIAWVGLSIYANFQEYNFVEIKKEPSVEKAQYEFKIVTTGEVLLTEDFDSVTSGTRDKYILHGYYKVTGDKWQYSKNDLTLDEKFFGPIEWQIRYN